MREKKPNSVNYLPAVFLILMLDATGHKPFNCKFQG
jgi:hypothetical protein